MNQRPLWLSTLLSVTLLSACSLHPQSEEPQTIPAVDSRTTSDTVPTVADTPPKPSVPPRAFTSETLYALLAAELASSRDRFDIALANYYQQAKITRDPQVAARATLYARFLNADRIALETSLLWVELDPLDSEAQLNAALALMQNGQLQEAFELSRQLQQKGEHTLFQNIAANATNLTDTQRETLLASYKGLLQEIPEDEQLLVGTGLLLQQQERLQEALGYAEQVLALYPESAPGAILEANLLHQLGRYEESVSRLADLLEYYPHNTRLRLQYARLLTQTDLAASQEQFEILVEQAPRDPELLLSLGIISLERNDTETAATAFEQLLRLGQHRSAANYYLGQIAESEDDPQTALEYYLQVEPGSDFLAATLRIVDIYVRQEDHQNAEQHLQRLSIRFPEQAEAFYFLHAQALYRHSFYSQARDVLGAGLKAYPENSDLLYTRALIHEKLDDLAAAENDLRTLIKYEPNNAAALNALGYILTDRTDRHEEAFELISKALSIKPDDGAIIDSLGWVHYRLGNHAQAIHYLNKAMAIYPDAEVAAHLGEVLWVTGAQREAQQVWQYGLELEPDSTIIRQTIKRLTQP